RPLGGFAEEVAGVGMRPQQVLDPGADLGAAPARLVEVGGPVPGVVSIEGGAKDLAQVRRVVGPRTTPGRRTPSLQGPSAGPVRHPCRRIPGRPGGVRRTATSGRTPRTGRRSAAPGRAPRRPRPASGPRSTGA